MVQETVGDPLSREMASLFEQLDSLPIPESESSPIKTDLVNGRNDHDDQVLRLKEYRDSQPNFATQHKPKSVPKVLFSNEQKERVGRLNEEVAQEEQRRKEVAQEEQRRKIIEEERKRREAEEQRRQEEERQRKLQEQFNNAMRKLSGMTFSSNQEARRFYMNIIASLPEEVARKITDRVMGWRCNYADCVHASPGDCGDPSQGGVWLIR
jgi:hypothetical protein